MPHKNLKEVEKMDQVSEQRLWKVLDSIGDRLAAIEESLSKIVRLEERVNNHEQSLTRYATRLDTHDSRIREAELWQANHGDRSSNERLIANIQNHMDEIEKKVDAIKSDEDIIKGKRDFTLNVFKWIAGILGAIIAYNFTIGVG